MNDRVIEMEPEVDEWPESEPADNVQEEREERGIPSINAATPSRIHRGVVAVTVVGGLLGAAGLGYLSYSTHARGKGVKETPKEAQIEVPTKTFTLRSPAPAEPPTGPREEMQPPPLTPPPSASQPPTAPQQTGVGPTPAQAGALDKTGSSLMIAAGTEGRGAIGKASSPQSLQRAQDVGPLGSMLGGTSTQVRVASTLKNRDFLLARGGYIDCALQTKLDTTVSGLTVCVVTRDVYGDTGKLVVIERGSQVTGEYQSNMSAGQARIFVLWNRVKTPAGVVIDLDSPGVDPLGASGVAGTMDTHFLERFGGAILLSLVQDVGAAAANAAAGATGSITLNNTTSTSQGMVAEALRSSINIPPTVVKNQGDRVGIMVARDLDFGSVYGYAFE